MKISSIWMIRNGSFGFDYNIKLILSIATIIMVLYDWKTKKRLDYLWVFLIATAFWAGIEALQQLLGIRQMTTHLLLGFPLPIYISAPIQGMAEAAFVAVFGLFVGDRLVQDNKWKVALIPIITFIVFQATMLIVDGGQAPNVGGAVYSRRDMFTLASILLVSVMSALAVIFYVKADKELRKRGLMMLGGMFIVSISFTIFQWFGGVRWIEIGTLTTLARAPPLIEFGALAYDALIEVGLIYVPFFTVPVWVKLIKSEEI